MELCYLYLDQLIKINPTLNDFFLYEKWSDKKHIQPNIYSEDFYEKLYELHKDFLKRINQKKEKTVYDEIL